MEDCQARPGIVRMVGPFPRATRPSLVFNPAFPCGVERGSTFAAADDVPLKRIATFGACIDPEPGAKTLVRGTVLARARAVPAGELRPVAPRVCDADVQNSALQVKLRVAHCDDPVPVIIDADSAVVMPAGQIQIDVLVPGDVPADPFDWSTGVQQLAAPQTVLDVLLRVSACPLRGCYCPDGQLTEYLQFIDTEAAINRILLRPQRARSLEISQVGQGSVNATFLRDLTGALAGLGLVSFNSGNAIDYIRLAGASPAILLGLPAAGTSNVYVRWRIE